jgi:hypothetical protein
MKLKPIYVYKVTLGLTGTFKQIENLHNTVKRITERLNEVNDFHGSIRVITENPEGVSDFWEMRIITPPVPKDHRIVHALGGIKLTLFEEKRVYSMCDSITKATF